MNSRPDPNEKCVADGVTIGECATEIAYRMIQTLGVARLMPDELAKLAYEYAEALYRENETRVEAAVAFTGD